MPAIRIILSICVLQLVFLGVYGQYGPFGIGNSDGTESPTGYIQPRLLLWLDGSEVQTTSGFVTQWTDKSGNGHHFLPPAASNRPVLQNTSGPSGTPCLSFDGVDDRLVCNNMEMTGNGFSIYCIFKTTDNYFGFYSYGTSSDPDTVLIYNDNGIIQRMGSAERNSLVGNESTGSWEYFGIWWNRADSRLWEYESGSSSVYEVSNGFANGFLYNPSGEAVIGDIPLAGGGFETGGAFQGQIAELFIWEGHMTRPIARMMRTYIWTKYGQNSNSLFREPSTTGWDKFQAYSSGSGGEHYHTIAVGRDNGPNPGEHCESRLNGLVLRVNKDPSSEWTRNRAYMCAGWVPDAGNSIVTTNLPAGVDARWSRVWEIGSTDDNSERFRIGFDFGEGIGGDIPQVAENFVLLRRLGNTGTFGIVPESQYLERSIVDDEVVFRILGSNIDDLNRYFTIGTKNTAVSSLDGSTSRTWYAYQTGNWSNPTTWTLDGSAAPSYVNPGGIIPAPGDNIVIGSGRTVTVDTSPISQSNLTVNGTLDVSTQPQPAFTGISGSGIIRCAGNGGISNFPTGNSAAFADPNTGGTAIFYGIGGITQTEDLTVNNLEINFNSVGNNLILAADLVHNGSFEITRGTFTVNNLSEVNRSITSYGSVIVTPNGRVRVSTQATNRKHTWSFHSNLINSGGDFRLTNRTSAAYSEYANNETQHWVTARFVSGTENQLLTANGITYLSQIIVNKGADPTYKLTITSSNANYFKLLGRSVVPGDSPYVPEGNWTNCSLGLVNGTVEIRENIFVPLGVTSGNYTINETAMLWVNGGSAGKGPAFIPGSSTSAAIVPYGIIKLSAGLLVSNCISGITTRANGLIQVDGGLLETNSIRTSVFGPTNVGGLIINAGEVIVDGSQPGGSNPNYYTFSLTYPGNLFRMAGGELRVAGPTGRGLIFINSEPEQTSVSGGTVIAEVKNTSATHRITSKAPFWNLEIERTSTSATNSPVIVTGGNSFGEIIPDQDLIIKNSITIKGANAATLDMNDLDLYVQGDMTVQNGGIYDHGLNTTYFDGNANSLLYLPTTLPTQTFNNVRIDKDSDTRFAEVQVGNSTRAMEVLGTFTIENGFFENNNRNISLKGDVVNKRSFGTSTSTGYAICEGTAPQTITSSNGIFHTLRIDNAAGVTLAGDDLVVRRIMQILNGVFDLQSYKLRVEAPLGSLSVSAPNTNKCFVTDGNASSGGLEVAFKSASQQTTYPIGVRSGGSVEYTPAIIRINSGFVDTGYVRVAPVDTLLLTTDITAASHYLNYYWKVNHSEFENIPNVSHRFQYLQADVIGDEDSLASGRVLFELPFTRSVDSTNVFNDNVNISSNLVFYNGPAENGTLTGVGTPLVNADYTAAHRDRFLGGPEIYYSRSTSIGASWNTASNWTNQVACPSCVTAEDFHGTGNPASDYPKAGDIAFIGYVPASGQPHVYNAPAGGIEASQVNFTQMKDGFGNPVPRYFQSGPANLTLLRPTLIAGSTVSIEKVGEINGEGALKLTGFVDLETVNAGNFLAQDSSIIILESSSALLDFLSFPPNIPNLFVTSDNNGSNDRIVRIRNDVTIRGNLEIAGNANLLLNDGAFGDILVGNDLKLARYQALTSGAELLFDNAGTPRNLDVRGEITIKDSGSRIAVEGPNSTPQLVHELIAWKDITQNASGTTGLNLYSSLTSDYVSLRLRGTGNHQFINLAGNTPKLGRLILDKGIDVSSSFTFNGDVDIDGPSDQAIKSISLENGLLSLDNAGIDITLSSGGGDFSIPSSAGLELNNGTLRVNGLETGLILDGLLRINGGLLEIGDTDGENNFIEYSPSGSALMEITAGTLNVGSQVRRGLTNISGVLDYRQSGGQVNLGIYDAPAANRGILEVVNPGSRFEHTGGTLTFVQGVNSSSTPSLFLEPAAHIIGAGSNIIIGSSSSPSGAAIKNFGIQSQIALNNLEINNDSGNDPDVRLQVYDLELDGLLDIDAGASLRCSNRDLILNNDVVNDGLLESLSGTVRLNHIVTGTVSGSGTFDLFDLERTGGGLTTVSTDLLVKNDFSLDTGDMDCGSNDLEVRGDANIDGHLIFSSASNGLIFKGGANQFLTRSGGGTSYIDAISIENGSGVSMVSGANYTFIMDKDLRLSSGVFALQGNLLELGVNSSIVPVNAFDNNNMISTGGAFTNFGVRKFVPANSTDDYLIPLGIDVYMPVRLDFSEPGYSSGSLISNYLFKLNVPQNPVVVEDSEAPDPEIVDVQNVLGMYFSVDASNIGTGLEFRAVFQYSDDYVNVTSPYTEADYLGAKVVNDGSPSPPIPKFPGAVDDVNNTITFEYTNATEALIDGDYFAGIDGAIPDFVPLYETTRNGDVDEGFFPGGVYDQATLGNGVPNGSVVVINSPHTLTLNVDGVNLYKTIIEDGATLLIDGTSFHRLGIVEGEGTIQLVGSGSLPAGTYNEFFTCFGGKLIYEGDGTNYEILANLPIVRKVDVIGSGQLTVSNNDVSICEDFTLNGPTLNSANGTNFIVNGDFIIQGGTVDFRKGVIQAMNDFNMSGSSTVLAGNSGTTFIEGNLNLGGLNFNFGEISRETRLRGNLSKTSGDISGGGEGASLIFDGSIPQEINGDFVGTGDQIKIMEIDNSSGLSLNNSIEITDTLFLTEGLINTTSSAKVIFPEDTVSVFPEGGSPNSFINGPMDWDLGSGASEPKFPVGKNDRFRPVVITDRSASRIWTVEYYDTLAFVEPSVISMDPLDPGLIRTVSIQEYWSINSNTGSSTTARVGLSWGDNSAVSNLPADYQKLVVLAYDEGLDLWDSYGADGSSFSYDVGSNQGEFLASAPLAFTEKYVTLGSRDAINPLPVSWLYFEGETEDDIHKLKWATATEIENDYFALERSVNTNDWVEISRIAGAGNSTAPLYYTFDDYTAPVGIVYYRLRQVDYDSDFDYAPNIVALYKESSGKIEELDFVVYPNPTSSSEVRFITGEIQMEIADVRLYDLTGKLVDQDKIWFDSQGVSDSYSCNFKSGIYLVSLTSKGITKTKKLVIKN